MENKNKAHAAESIEVYCRKNQPFDVEILAGSALSTSPELRSQSRDGKLVSSEQSAAETRFSLRTNRISLDPRGRHAVAAVAICSRLALRVGIGQVGRVQEIGPKFFFPVIVVQSPERVVESHFGGFN